tara:strand:- start:5385 stop:6032 length:648 start_codon:yes stop_codon:yes gene_type:complete
VSNEQQGVYMKLIEIADVISGRTFKHGVAEAENWTHSVIQLRDVLKDKHAIYIDWESLTKTDLSRSTVNTLEHKDILIIAKGMMKQAILIDEPQQQTTVTQHLFIIRVKDSNQYSAEFLKHYLNSDVAQAWMHNNSSGQYQSTMSKRTLSDLPVPNLGLEQQQILAQKAYQKLSQIREHQVAIFSLEQGLDTLFREVSEMPEEHRQEIRRPIRNV